MERYFTRETEDCLIRAALAGDLRARDQLVVAAVPFLRKKLRYLGVDDQHLEDAVQDAVVATIEAIQRYDIDHPRRARLYGFVKRSLLQIARGYRQGEPSSLCLDDVPEPATDDDPGELLLSVQRVRLARTLIGQLPPRERAVLYARRASDAPEPRRVLAERFGCPPRVVQLAEQRAIDRLRAAAPRDELPTTAAEIH